MTYPRSLNKCQSCNWDLALPDLKAHALNCVTIQPPKFTLYMFFFFLLDYALLFSPRSFLSLTPGLVLICMWTFAVIRLSFQFFNWYMVHFIFQVSSFWTLSWVSQAWDREVNMFGQRLSEPLLFGPRTSHNS